MNSSRAKLSSLGGLKEGDLYIERAADAKLLTALRRADYAYVLSSRQTGKTSLMIRTLRQLRREGFRCAKVDLGSLGTDPDPVQWYHSLAVEIAEAAGCGDTFADPFFALTVRRTPVQRFTRFLRSLLAQSDSSLVIFIDEVESFLKLPMRVADDFLAAIRSCFNDRDREPLFRKLAFCLLGVCTPTELIRDERRTPFNVARSIHLEDFTWEATRGGFLPALGDGGPEAEACLRGLHDWSGGHPYLTHRLVEEVQHRHEDGAELSQALADQAVADLFLGQVGLGREHENFLEVERRLCLGPAHRVQRRLALYRALLRGERVPVRGHDPIQIELRIAGLVRELRTPGEPPHLGVRNRIFAAVFDESWAPKVDPAKLDPTLWMKDQIERWNELGRKDAFVLRGEELFEARKWAEAQPSLEPACRDFLAASSRVDNRERGLRLNSLLFMTLWASSASFLMTPLLLDYWQHRGYPWRSAIGYLYAIPFLFALPAGALTDRRHVRSSSMIVGGLACELVGALMLLWDLVVQKFSMAAAAVSLMVLGQTMLRPQAAVLLGALYPRRDRRADMAFAIFYVFVNLGALLGPLIGSALYKQYGWKGAIGTLCGGISIALYGFLASYSAFNRVSFPIRDDLGEPSRARRRRQGIIVLLWLTMLIFWCAFYLFGEYLGQARRLLLKEGEANLDTGNLLAQGISSEAITPLFVILLTPCLIGAFYLLRSRKAEPSVPAKLAGGGGVFFLLLIGAVIWPNPQLSSVMIGSYLLLTLAEMLIVPASMAGASALASSRSLFTMMSASYLTAGIGALLAGSLITSSRLTFVLLAIGTVCTALLWASQRSAWGEIVGEQTRAGPD